MALRLLLGLCLILLGYGLATLASAVAVSIVFAIDEGMALHDVPGVIGFAAILIGMYAALPALSTVATAEFMPVRRRVYYVIAATLIGMVLPLIVGLPHWYVAVGLAFGPVAGLIYWLVAGRRAGLWPSVRG